MKTVFRRRLIWSALALGALASVPCLLPGGRADPAPQGTPAPAAPAPPPAPIRYVRNIPGDSKPLLMDADEVATWADKGRRIVLLQGQVLIQQGVVRLRADAAAVFIDLDSLKRIGILRAEVYAEGAVRLEDGREAKQSDRGTVELNTRGELRLKSHKRKAVQRPMPNSPLFKRAQAERAAALGPPAGKPPGDEENAEKGAEVPPPPVAPPPGLILPPSPGSRQPTAAEETSGKKKVPDGDNGPGATPVRVAERRATTVDRRSAAEQPPAPPGEADAPGGRLLIPVPRGGQGPLRQYSIVPRTGGDLRFDSRVIGGQEIDGKIVGGEQVTVITGGAIVNVRDAAGGNLIDIEADVVLIWSRGGLSPDAVEGLRRPEGQTSRELEFYLAGNVVIRQRDSGGERVLRAAEIYLDASRNVAIALTADLSFIRPGLPQPVHVRADEMRQLSETKYEVLRAEVFSSKLPSDPGLKVFLTEATIEEVRVPVYGLFGRPVVDRRTGQPLVELQRPVVGRWAYVELEDVPVLFFPYFQGDANDPLGPIESLRLGGNRIFGFEAGVSLDVYDLFGIQPYPDTRWLLTADYLSRRGPALGTEFDYARPTFLDLPARVAGLVRAWGIHDDAPDILGGGRGEREDHPDWRGRFLFRQNVQELPEGFSFQAQLAAMSDRNVVEQYFKPEFDQDINRETFLYLKRQQGNRAWTGLVKPRLTRDWVNETEWLPRADGYLLGQSFFDRFTYHAHAGAGYAMLENSADRPPVALSILSPTDVATDTGRFHLTQELSLPFYLGPVKVAPYGIGDLAYYTRDLTGEDNGRAWGGGGVRASLPLTRLYPDVKSLLFNVHGLNHKVVLSGNYLYARSTDPFNRFPQLDRLHDNATDQALRDLFPRLPAINPDALFLATSPLFDPQVYAIRRLVHNRIDTLDDIHVVQLDLRQRLQTKRGFPGQRHIVDWMTLGMSASVFPDKNRDNFGETFGFLEYDYTWNIGDRTALVSTGWIDPIDNGPRVYTVGTFLDRPDRTSFYFGYRQIDPVDSKAVTGAATYIFSPKYALTASSTYDFGTNDSLANSLVITRLGADLNVSVGFTYNALQENFGVTFVLVPNLVPLRRQLGGLNALGPSGPFNGL